MNARERYNKIINTIEDLAKGKNINGTIAPVSDHDISNKAFEVAHCSTMNDNSKNVMFLFLNNCTVIDYIKERKMVAVYRMLYDCKEWSKNVQNNAIEMAGLSDYQGLCKKFKKCFGISPKKAFENKEATVVPGIRDWDSISTDGRNVFVKFDEVDMVNEKFGISREKFIAAHAAANLQSFYKLNDYESEIAFKLAEDRELSIKDTFEYIYNYVWSFIDEDSLERGKRLEKDLLKPEVIYMYFDCSMSFNEILMVLVALKKCKLPREFKDTNRLYLLGFQKFSNHMINYQKDNFCSYITPNDRLKDIRYEDIFTYYREYAEQRDTEKVFLEFVEACTHLPFEHALEHARFRAFEYLNMQKYYEEPIFEEGNGLRCDEYEDEFISNPYEYEPDVDDMDIVEDLFMDHDELEEFTAYENAIENMDFTFEEFNHFCDKLDAKDATEDAVEDKLESNRRLVGYTSLDIEEVVKARIDRFGDTNELPFN